MKKLIYVLLFLTYPPSLFAWGILERAVERVNTGEGAPYLIEKINEQKPVNIMLVYPDSPTAEQSAFEDKYNTVIEQNIARAIGHWQKKVLSEISKLPEARQKAFADVKANWSRKDLINFVRYGKGYADLRVNVYINGSNFTGCSEGALACAYSGTHLQMINISFNPKDNPADASQTERGLPFYDAFLHEFGHSLGLADQGYADADKNHSVAYSTANNAPSVMTGAARNFTSVIYAGPEDPNSVDFQMFKADFKKQYGIEYPRGGYRASFASSVPVSPDDVEGIIALSDLFKPANAKPVRFVNGWESFVRKDFFYLESHALPKNVYEQAYAKRKAQGLLASEVNEEAVKKEIQNLPNDDLKQRISIAAAASPLAATIMPQDATNVNPNAPQVPQTAPQVKKVPAPAAKKDMPAIPKVSGFPAAKTYAPSLVNRKLTSPVKPKPAVAVNSGSLPAPIAPKPTLLAKSAPVPPTTVQPVNNTVYASPVEHKERGCYVCGGAAKTESEKYIATQSRWVHKSSMCAYKYFAKRFPVDPESLKSYDAVYNFSTPANVTAARGLMKDLGLTTAAIRGYSIKDEQLAQAPLEGLKAAKAEQAAKAAADDERPLVYQTVTLEQVSGFAAANKEVLKSIRAKNKSGKPLTAKENRILKQYRQMYANYQISQKYSK